MACIGCATAREGGVELAEEQATRRQRFVDHRAPDTCGPGDEARAFSLLALTVLIGGISVGTVLAVGERETGITACPDGGDRLRRPLRSKRGIEFIVDTAGGSLYKVDILEAVFQLDGNEMLRGDGIFLMPLAILGNGGV